MNANLIHELGLFTTKIVIGASMLNGITIYRYGHYVLAHCNEKGQPIPNITIWDWRIFRVACVAPEANAIRRAISDYQNEGINRHLAYTNSEADLIIQQKLS